MKKLANNISSRHLLALFFVSMLIFLTPATAKLAAQNVNTNLNEPITSPVTPPTTPPSEYTLPVIDTNSLPDGQVGVEYRARVLSHDNNPNDKIVTTLTGLPRGLKMNSNDCRISVSHKGIQRSNCKIKGTPLKNGIFKVSVAVCNDLGCTSKDLELKISK